MTAGYEGSAAMTAGFAVGQSVTVKRRIWGHESGANSPMIMVAKRGDRLIVRAVRAGGFSPYPIHVSHEDVTDGLTFGVSADEIAPLNNQGAKQ